MRRYPVASAGTSLFVLLFAGVSGNALWGQAGPHPSPLIATRGGTDASARPLANQTHLMPVPLVEEVQNALTKAGYYKIAVDGRPGPATSTAIRAFQKANGLNEDGVASPTLLAQVRQITTQPPSPSARPYEKEDAFEEVASLEPQAERGGRVVQTARVPEPASEDESQNAELVRQIQAGLTAAQVAELAPDGIPGARTRAAIRTFEALEGMPVTGEPAPRILSRLKEIGAF